MEANSTTAAGPSSQQATEGKTEMKETAAATTTMAAAVPVNKAGGAGAAPGAGETTGSVEG